MPSERMASAMRWTINIVAISLGSSEPEQASMPIRQRGRLARRRSSWDLQFQNNRTALIEAHQMERVLADIDADCSDCR